MTGLITVVLQPLELLVSKISVWVPKQVHGWVTHHKPGLPTMFVNVT